MKLLQKASTCCFLLFSLLEGNENYRGDVYCTAVGVNHYSNSRGELGMDKGVFEQKFPSYPQPQKGREEC